MIELWQAWKAGHYPQAGGWLDQPLELIAQIHAIDTVYNTYRFKTAKNADWTKMTKTQTEIIRWLDE